MQRLITRRTLTNMKNLLRSLNGKIYLNGFLTKYPSRCGMSHFLMSNKATFTTFKNNNYNTPEYGKMHNAPNKYMLFALKNFNTTNQILHSTAKDNNSLSSNCESSAIVNITFIFKDGKEVSVDAQVGETLLETAHRHHIPIEGACEGSLACSTCHVIFDESTFNKLPEASEREDDLLDMAPHLTDTSRLSCQIKITKDLDGIKVTLPKSTLNFYVDGYVATHDN